MSQVTVRHPIPHHSHHIHHDPYPPSPPSTGKATNDLAFLDDDKTYTFHPSSPPPHSDRTYSESLRTADALFPESAPLTFVMDDSAGFMNSKLGQITPPEDTWRAEWTMDYDPAIAAVDEAESSKETSGLIREASDELNDSGIGRPTKSGKRGRVDKRDKYREKNRVAAAKCRAKKKEHIDGLEDNHRTQGMLNALLKQTEQQLRDELSYWRTQALQHGFCECQAIQEYNLRKARALAANKEFGDMDSIRRDSVSCSSPSSQMMPNMYPDPHHFGSPPS